VPGQSDARSALTEAWEEAGVRADGEVGKPLGSFLYFKTAGPRGRHRLPAAIETTVYPIEVASLADHYPEAGQRRRQWVTPDKAATMIEEPGLRALLKEI
jgi:8-oxo-dGTP pyrophosphatase MutT (NUDIX family)